MLDMMMGMMHAYSFRFCFLKIMNIGEIKEILLEPLINFVSCLVQKFVFVSCNNLHGPTQ